LSTRRRLAVPHSRGQPLVSHYRRRPSRGEAIVVGIAYGSFDPSINRRGFDFSTPVENGDPERGGAAAFHDFLKSELIPQIENRYRTDPSRRVLFGQSRGGSMVLYSAFTDPDLFWGRIASNPAFDPGRELFFSPAAPANQEDLGRLIDERIRDLAGWRGATLARMRALIFEADPEVTEEWKWGVPVWSHDGIAREGRRGPQRLAGKEAVARVVWS
jgi:hypothetical protein